MDCQNFIPPDMLSYHPASGFHPVGYEEQHYHCESYAAHIGIYAYQASYDVSYEEAEEHTAGDDGCPVYHIYPSFLTYLLPAQAGCLKVYSLIFKPFQYKISYKLIV